MARTNGPLMSLEASGSVAGTLTFAKWKGRQYVRQLVVPSNPQSGLQVGMRAAMKFITQNYASLSDTIKSHWKTVADPLGITPLNAQVRACQPNIRAGAGCIQDPTAVAGTTPNAPATGTATAAYHSLLLAWTHPATNPGNYTTMIWMSKTTGFTPAADTLVAVVPQSQLALTIANLIGGQTYYFRIAETNTDGTIGALKSEFSGTAGA